MLIFVAVGLQIRLNGVRLVVSKSEKRAKKDAHARKKGMERLEKRFNTGKLTKANFALCGL